MTVTYTRAVRVTGVTPDGWLTHETYGPIIRAVIEPEPEPTPVTPDGEVIGPPPPPPQNEEVLPPLPPPPPPVIFMPPPVADDEVDPADL